MTPQTKLSKQATQIEQDILLLRMDLRKSLAKFWEKHGLVPNVEVIRLDRVDGRQVLGAINITVTIGYTA